MKPISERLTALAAQLRDDSRNAGLAAGDARPLVEQAAAAMTMSRKAVEALEGQLAELQQALAEAHDMHKQATTGHAEALAVVAWHERQAQGYATTAAEMEQLAEQHRDRPTVPPHVLHDATGLMRQAAKPVPPGEVVIDVHDCRHCGGDISYNLLTRQWEHLRDDEAGCWPDEHDTPIAELDVSHDSDTGDVADIPRNVVADARVALPDIRPYAALYGQRVFVHQIDGRHDIGVLFTSDSQALYLRDIHGVDHDVPLMHVQSVAPWPSPGGDEPVATHGPGTTGPLPDPTVTTPDPGAAHPVPNPPMPSGSSAWPEPTPPPLDPPAGHSTQSHAKPGLTARVTGGWPVIGRRKKNDEQNGDDR